MTYPLKDFSRNTTGIATHDLIGKNGLQRVMTFVESGSEKKDFEYDSDILQTFGRIFSPNEIGKYSSKIESVIQQVQKTSGITLIFSQYIDGGIVPMALALEELGFQRFGDTKSLFKDRPSKKMQGTTPKYIIISGEKNISPNNLLEINAISDKNNKDGNIIKVALISRAGSEGIDFKNIRDVHILDPWYNTNRIEQIIGRAIRLKSHCALPFIQRNARIFVYGTLLTNMEDEAADMYIHRVAEVKALQIGNITRTLKETAVDCILNHEQNNFTEDNMNTIIKIDLANLSLSKADFLPFFLITIISLYCTLSKVVNLAPQTHNLLLRIAAPSSVGRESTTEVSPFLHMEQIIYSNFYRLGKKNINLQLHFLSHLQLYYCH